MGISVLFKIAAIGILTIVVSQLFQHQGKGDLATLSSLAGLVVVLAIVLSMVSDLFDTIKTLFELY
ncbi:MAG: stage III sporulation protein AC [Clostridia bacterium]|nr:stage III sporulation protein AC [Clostridiales bacterium]MBQ7918045.1 stage III sporulation protein AC [Clostridia bacterium]